MSFVAFDLRNISATLLAMLRRESTAHPVQAVQDAVLRDFRLKHKSYQRGGHSNAIHASFQAEERLDTAATTVCEVLLLGRTAALKLIDLSTDFREVVASTSGKALPRRLKKRTRTVAIRHLMISATTLSTELR